MNLLALRVGLELLGTEGNDSLNKDYGLERSLMIPCSRLMLGY